MSGQSPTSIANRALQGLGASTILAMTDASREARAALQCYDPSRRAELRAHVWKFARKRAVLPAAADKPAFGYKYAFPLPPDFLRLLLPRDSQLDWNIEGRAILTNAATSPYPVRMDAGRGPALGVAYIADIQDATLFDPCFCEALAARMQMSMCEQLTQSNQKLQAAQAWYKQVMGEAVAQDALERLPQSAPPDPWIVAHWT